GPTPCSTMNRAPWASSSAIVGEGCRNTRENWVMIAESGEAVAHDRRLTFTPLPRPEWMSKLNALGRGLDVRSIIPLTSSSLMERASAVTGLEDFGSDDWREPF